MPRRREACTLQLHRSWAWRADGERRWLHAFRLLLAEEPVREAQAEEGCQGTGRGSVCPRLNRPPGRGADQ
jgi:hypothetical protein